MAKRANKRLLMVISILVTMLYAGFVFQFGSFFQALLDTYNMGRSSTSIVQSLFVGVAVGFGVVSGFLIKRFGLPIITLASSCLATLGFFLSFFATNIEYLYAYIGIISGIGFSMGYMSAIVVITTVFSGQQMVFCLSVQSASIVVAGLIYPYLVDILISLYGLRGSFLVWCAIFCNTFTVFIACWMNKEILNEVSLKTQDHNEVSTSGVQNEKKNVYRRVCETIKSGVQDVNILISQKTYLIVLVSASITMASSNGFLGLVLDICKWKGFEHSDGLLSFVHFNMSTLLTRLLIGTKKRIRLSSFMFPISSLVCGCISGLLLYFGTSFSAYIAAIWLTGIATGGVVGTVSIIPVKLVPLEQVPIAVGLQMTTIGIVTTGIGPIYGTLRDMSGSYDSVFLTIIAVQATGVILYSLAFLHRRRKDSKNIVSISDIFIVTKF